jgi:SAM-dependent methyltransferase
LKKEAHLQTLHSQSCDLCGSTRSEMILRTKRLDGPLMRCTNCRLFFVQLPEKILIENGGGRTVANGGTERVAAEMVRLAERARELSLVEHDVEQNERPWRELSARERLDDLRRFVPGGKLLEVGSSTGEMLLAAGPWFDAAGVEPDQQNCRIARSRGLNCIPKTLIDAAFPDASFDIAASYHVIEHVPSPRNELAELRRIIKPGGWLALETPNIANIWYKLIRSRWRQFIPDHIYFFTPQTLSRLCEQSGFEIQETRTVGKPMSVRLFLSRLGRYHKPLATMLESASQGLNLDDRTMRLKLGDVVRIYARRLP